MISFKSFKYNKLALAALCSLLFSFNSYANKLDKAMDTYLPDDFQWHGFLSQGFSLTDHNNFLGSSEDGSFKFNEVGLGASWQPTSQLHFSLQGVYRQTGNSDPQNVQLDYGIIDWRTIDTFDFGMGFRIGRLKNAYAFYNETRDIAATTPSVLLPQSTYIDYLRSLAHSSDSIGFYAHHDLGHGIVSFDISSGKPVIEEDAKDNLVGVPTSGKLDHDQFHVGRIGYESGSGLWRIAFSHGELTTDFSPAPTELIQSGSISVRQSLISLEVNWQEWQLITEHQKRYIASRNIFFGQSFETKGDSYYYQLGFSFTDRLQAYMRRDVIYRNNDDKDGSQWLASDPAPVSRTQHEAFAKDTTLGVRYLPNNNWTLGAEVHHINGTYWLPDVENPNKLEQKQRWNLFLLKAEYRF